MAKEMRLIPEDEYQRLMKIKATCIHDTSSPQKTFDERLLFLEDSKIPDDIKVDLLSNFEKRRARNNISGKPPKDETEETTKTESPKVEKSKPKLVRDASTHASRISTLNDVDLSLITRDFTDQARSHAKLVLTLFKNNPSVMKWNKTGAVSFFNYEFDDSINVTDLLSYAFRHVTMPMPIGFNRFMKACSYVEFPHSMFTPRAKLIYSQFLKDSDYRASTPIDPKTIRFEPLLEEDKL